MFTEKENKTPAYEQKMTARIFASLDLFFQLVKHKYQIFH